MNNVGDFLKRVFGFFVSSPRRKFADKTGIFFGKASVLIMALIISYAMFSDFGVLSCGSCILFVAPVLFFLETFGIGGGFISEIIGYMLIVFPVYYIVGYSLGALFFLKENSATKTKKKKN